MKSFLLYALLCLIVIPSFTQENLQGWQFKKEKDGIRVYTRDLAGSNLKELRIIFYLEASLSTVVALIGDIPAYKNWVYRCTESANLKKISDLETYDYYRVDFPWPFSDRDMIMHSVMSQHPHTKVVTSYTTARPAFAGPVEGFVRICEHMNKWIFTPLSEDRVKVDYVLKSDPAGNIPDWLINMALDQGPVQSMKRMQQMVRSATYKNKQIAGIINY